MQLKTGKGLNAQQRGMAGINYNSLMVDFNRALLKKKKKEKWGENAGHSTVYPDSAQFYFYVFVAL